MKSVIQLILLLFSLLVAQAQDTVTYSADKVLFGRRDSVIQLTGNSRLQYEGVYLSADSIHYHTGRKLLIATGNPTLIDGTDTLVGDYIAYNLNDKTGKVRTGYLDGEEDLNYTGERIARGDDNALYIDNGSYTTSKGVDSVHYYFYGKQIKIIPNDKSIVKPFVLNIEDAPVAVLPYLMAPLEKNRKNGLLNPNWGVAINGSGSVDNIGYYWAPNDYIDFLTAAKIDNFESYIIKGESRYALKNKLSGSVYGDFSLNDRYRGGSNRWSLRYNHNQNLLPDRSLTLKGRGQIVSDRNYHTDYSEDTTQLLNQILNSNIAISKDLRNLGGNLSAGWDMTQNLSKETTEMKAPSGSFRINNRSLIPAPTGADPLWFNKISWSYRANVNQELKISTKADSSYNRTVRGFSQTLPISAPFEVFDYFTLTPRFTVSHAVFDTYFDTTTYDTVFVPDTTYGDTITLEATLDSAYRKSVEEGTIIVYDTLYPPHSFSSRTDTLVRINQEITSHKEVRKDTTHWYEDDYTLEKASNVWWNTGVDLNTTLYGVFPMKLGNLTGIRHTLKPSVGYLFTPEKELNVSFPSISGITSTRGTKQRQEIRLGLSNIFEARIEKENSDQDKKVSFLRLGANASYNFESDTTKWSNISVTGGVPTPVVDLSYSGTYTPYDEASNMIVPEALYHSLRVNPRLPAIKGSLWGGDMLMLEKVAHDSYMDGLAKANSTGWSVNLRPNYNMTLRRKSITDPFAQTKTYNLGAGFQLDFSHRWSARWNGTWSFTEGTFINQSLSLYGDLESWELKFDWYPTGINSGRFYFLVNIKKHRDIQWQKKDN